MPIHQSYYSFGRSLFSVLLLLLLPPGLAKAQITPDGTIPTSIQKSGNMQEINGGQRAGDNLFYSFEEFSIPTGMEASFNNAIDIKNIFTRITGGDVSLIDGLLQTAGGANFFLVNPNGIVFGENARLDVGGSFIATTADKIEFADGTEFSARDSKVNLTISVPVGLGLLGDNGSITVNGNGNQITNDSSFVPVEFGQRPVGLSVNNGQTIALVGNRINLNGGVVAAEGGDIYLTSVEYGSVDIDQSKSGVTLTENNVIQYQDINLNQQSLIDASGNNVGSIFASGKNINLSNASFILSRNQGGFSGSSINIQASEKLVFSGTSENGNISSSIRSETLSTGEGASLDIFTNQLTLQDNAKLRTNSFSEAEGGSIKVNSESIQLTGGSLISASAFNSGNAGDVEISTSELRLIEAGSVTSSTLGKGNGGKVTIQANSIEVIGATESSISNISASTFSSGNAGNIKISTERLQIKDGGSVSSSTFAEGNAGNINVNTTDFVEVSGRNESFPDDRSLESTIRTAARAASIAGQRNLGLPAIPTGNSGSLTINTPSLTINNQAAITVANQGAGRAGKLIINADNLSLDTSGSINAAAESGQGGNIELNTKNLQIGDGSQITAEAGNDGNGGNININTGNLIAKKNSRVVADASKGDGGNILINAKGLFLFAPSEDIFSASSELGLEGNIIINTPDNDFDKSLELSELKIATLPDFQTPWCDNPDRVKLRINPGKLLEADAENYVILPEDNIELSSELEEIIKKLNPASEPEKKTNIYWKPGDSIANATKVVKTEDGRIFLLPPGEELSKDFVCGSR